MPADPSSTVGLVAQPALEARSSNNVEAGPLSILVVEDYPEGARTWALLLKIWGYPWRVVTNGTDALSACAQEAPDVIFLDLGLPDIDGWDVAQEIRKRPGAKRPLLVVVSARDQPADLRRSEEVGIDLHLVKPVDPEELLVILRRFARLLQRPDPMLARPLPDTARAPE